MLGNHFCRLRVKFKIIITHFCFFPHRLYYFISIENPFKFLLVYWCIRKVEKSEPNHRVERSNIFPSQTLSLLLAKRTVSENRLPPNGTRARYVVAVQRSRFYQSILRPTFAETVTPGSDSN